MNEAPAPPPVPSADELSLLQTEQIPPAEPAATAAKPHEHGVFARRIAAVFTTQIAVFVIAFATSILLARILGRDGKGSYYSIVTFPALISTFGMFGLPSAVNYFAGRGVSVRSLVKAAYILTAATSAILVGVVWVGLPLLEGSILSAAKGHDDLLRVIVLIIPFGIMSAFGGAILYGRQAVRMFSLIQITMGTLTLLWVIVGVGLMNLGLRGAVAGSAMVAVTTALLVMVQVHRLERATSGGQPLVYRGLASFGARLYPASLSGYFSYRADTYVLQAVLVNSPGPLGSYSMAVTMDELLFYVPNAIATLFLPRVAGSTAEDSNRMLGRVGRLTMLLTLCGAVCLIPVAYVGIHLVLPKFNDCIPAFLVLLPGVISLSTAKVMTSYVSGRGSPGKVAAGTMFAAILNVILCIILIPKYGIVGASLSSLISYTVQAAFAVGFASRLSGQSVLSLIVPGPEEIRLVITTVPRLLAGVPVVRRFVPAAPKAR